MLRPYFFACTFPPGAHSPAMTDLKRSLRLVDGLAMVVGIMVGSGIFRTPGLVAAQLGRPWLTFVAWIAGGALALVGALCFAELATRHPAAGGKYVYVREAFGPRAGFVVGWVEGLALDAPHGADWHRHPGRAGARLPGGDLDLLRLSRRRQDRGRSGRPRPHAAAHLAGRDRHRGGAVSPAQCQFLPGAADRPHRRV